ncbi:MAG: Nif3-like dinuclear metal center hexameric protein [Chromatiales bacterium]|nr:Nif3-like dinuclear metal center hexameric protein [Chromatiales bacterium]
MTSLSDISAYTDRYLEVGHFKDYSPNGLQVESQRPIRLLISGVTASQALIDAAIAEDGDAILVHHGYFWRNEEPTISGMKARRLRTLLSSGVGLLAYHIPLDAHDVVGNNVQLAKHLGISLQGCFGDYNGVPLARYGTIAPCDADKFADKIERVLSRPPQLIAGGRATIETVGLCTGAAQDCIEEAVRLGLDAYISGEISERTVHIAREEGIHYYAAGHHATERYGVQALGEHLAEHFDITHRYIEIDNPV